MKFITCLYIFVSNYSAVVGICVCVCVCMVTCYVSLVQSCHHDSVAVNSDVQLSVGVQHNNDRSTFK